MTIRTFQPGDDVIQVSIYNEAAGALPRFKPATVDEVRRRCRAADFDPTQRFFALDKGKPVGYASFHSNGRVSYPWCRGGHESLAEPLFEAVLDAMRQRGLTGAFAAYRGDWPQQAEFFLAHGFHRARDMINYVIDLADLPTASARLSSPIAPLTREDMPAVAKLAPEVLRTTSPEELEKYFLANPYFPPESLFCLRSRADGRPLAAGIVVSNPAYANPRQVDAAMPCFRLGAFGTEGMQTKRIHGLFSVLVRADRDANALALDLLGHAAGQGQSGDLDTLAAQVPSDVPHLVRFYQQYFQRQGSFPVFERAL
jgi:hypothetical protein